MAGLCSRRGISAQFLTAIDAQQLAERGDPAPANGGHNDIEPPGQSICPVQRLLHVSFAARVTHCNFDHRLGKFGLDLGPARDQSLLPTPTAPAHRLCQCRRCRR